MGFENRELLEAIESCVDSCIDGALKSHSYQEVSYHLEHLPVIEEYDFDVEGYIGKLKYSINHAGNEYLDMIREELIEFYYRNAKDYKEFEDYI